MNYSSHHMTSFYYNFSQSYNCFIQMHFLLTPPCLSLGFFDFSLSYKLLFSIFSMFFLGEMIKIHISKNMTVFLKTTNFLHPSVNYCHQPIGNSIKTSNSKRLTPNTFPSKLPHSPEFPLLIGIA